MRLLLLPFYVVILATAALSLSVVRGYGYGLTSFQMYFIWEFGN